MLSFHPSILGIAENVKEGSPSTFVRVNRQSAAVIIQHLNDAKEKANWVDDLGDIGLQM